MATSSRPRLRASFWLAGVSAAVLPCAGAQAQSVGATGTQNNGQLGEIVVTASKRETNVQKTPLAITAISNAALQQTHVVDAVDLNGLVPSLVISTSEGFERNVAIRGIGFNVPQNDSAQPSVSYHVDGVYIANPVALNTGFLDVNHVEVVRGPQGTVYGQNSTGGTLNVVTNQPTLGKFTGDGKLDVGNFGLNQFEGAVNVPVGDTFAVRAAIEVVHHNGFAKATQVPGTDHDYGLSDEDSLHARITALWKPTDRFSLTLRAEYAKANNHNTEGKSIFDPDPNPWHETSDWPGKLHYTNKIFAGTATYDFGFATLKALGSYQTVRQNGSINEDGLDVANAVAVYGVPGFTGVHDIEYLYHSSKAYTGEVDLASPTGQRLEWIVGAFYLSSKYHVAYDQYAIDSFPTPGVPGSLINQLFPPVTNGDDLGFEGENEFYFPYFYSISHLTRESYSLYGQSTFHINDRLRLTGGLRYTRDHNTTDICDYACAAPTFVQQTNTAITGKAGIEFDLARKTMAYASFSTGFKPGGGNISPAPIVLGFNFKPETIRAYEVGLKSTFLDNRVRLNLAGFYYDYKNLQYEAEDAVAYQGGVANIPHSKVYGFEAETSVLLPAHFRFDGSLTVEGSKITSHYDALDNVTAYNLDKQIFAQYPDGLNCVFAECRDQDIAAREAAFFDVHGNAMPNLPKFTAQGTLSHTYTFANGGVLTSSIQVQTRSHYINAVYGDIVIDGVHVYRTPGYTLANLFFGYTFPDSRWGLSLVVKNLADNAAVLGQFTNQFGGEVTRQYTPPRQFIGSVSFKF
jgi:iron complex outermembrane receptor protein